MPLSTTARTARVVNIHFGTAYELVDETGQNHWIYPYEVSPPLRGNLRQGDMVEIVYSSTRISGFWRISSKKESVVKHRERGENP